MMDSNVHIDPATFRFPGPPKSSVDRGSPLLTHPKHLLGQLQPRSAGFSYDWEVDRSNLLGEDLDARRFNRQICKELVKGPPDATQAQPPPQHRKRFIKIVFPSRSRRKSSKENKKMPVATHTTSNGYKYGQILSNRYTITVATHQLTRSTESDILRLLLPVKPNESILQLLLTLLGMPPQLFIESMEPSSR